MVSMKWMGVAAFVLVATCSVQATFFSVSPTPLVKCYNGYYSRFNFNLNENLNIVGTLLKGIFDAVGLVLQAVGNFLGALFGLHGFQQHQRSKDISSCLAQPKSEGEAINFVLKGIIIGKPIFDKVHYNLGAYFVKAATACLIIGVSSRSNQYNGLSFKVLDKTNKGQWCSQLGVDNIKGEWEGYLQEQNIVITNLTGPQRVIFFYINSLILYLASGFELFVERLLDDVLITVFGLIGLLGNLLDGLLVDILGLGWNYCGGFFSKGITQSVFEVRITRTVGRYGKGQFNKCFKG